MLRYLRLRWRAVFLGTLFLSLLAGCREGKAPQFGAEAYACQADSDCTLIYTTICGGVGAINVEYAEPWNKYLEMQRARSRVVCAPALPIENFEPMCLLQRCEAVNRYHRAILTLSDKPLLGHAVTLTLRFKFSADSPSARAWLELPPGLALIDGRLQWEGSLRGGEEGLLAAQVQATRPRFYHIRGVARPESDAYSGEVSDAVDVEVTPEDAILGSKLDNLWHRPEDRLAEPATLDHGLIVGRMLVTPEPALNELLTVTYEVTPLIDLTDPGPNYMSIQLPPHGFEIVEVQFPEGGEPYPDVLGWRGSVQQGQTVRIQLRLRVVDPGWGKVFGEFTVQAGGATRDYIQDVVFAELYVDKYGGYATAM